MAPEDPANEPMCDKILEPGISPEKVPDKPTYLTIGFEKGTPDYQLCKKGTAFAVPKNKSEF